LDKLYYKKRYEKITKKIFYKWKNNAHRNQMKISRNSWMRELSTVMMGYKVLNNNHLAGI